MNFKENDKLQYEVEKLIAEVKVLKQPWRLPTFWLGVVALSSSVSYNIYQFYTSDVKKERANLELEKIDLEKTKLESDRTRLSKEIDSQQTALANIKKEISSAQSQAVSEEVKQALQQATDNISTLQQSVDATSESLAVEESLTTSQFRNKVQIARAKERDGFEALIKNDYDAAASAFQAAEDAFNGYHSVHDIAKLLRDTKSERGDPAKMADVKHKIAREYSYLAPTDLLPKLKSGAK